MKSYQKSGEVVSLTAPYAVSGGAGMLVGSIFAVAAADAANGAAVEGMTLGEHTLTALTADTGSQGAKMYWDNTNKRLTTTSAGNTYVGCLTVAKLGTEAFATVRLHGAMV